MAIFIRAFEEANKEEAILQASNAIKNNISSKNIFSVDPENFSLIPNSPFAYWVSKDLLGLFANGSKTVSDSRVSLYGLISSDNFRFLRLNWEVPLKCDVWKPISKGGNFSKYYGDIYLTINTKNNFSEIVALANDKYPYLKGKARQMIHADIDSYFKPGVTWTKATTAPLSFRILPRNTVAGHGGSAFIMDDYSQHEILISLAILNSIPFNFLISLSLGLAAEGRKNYETGILGRAPYPFYKEDIGKKLESYARRSWFLKRVKNSVDETSYAFILPAYSHIGPKDYSLVNIDKELQEIENEVNSCVFDLYKFPDADRQIAITQNSNKQIVDNDDEDEDEIALSLDAFLSWVVGVVFGRFDWRLATGEREALPDPEPFDPLPEKSPGMLPNDAKPFHHHGGILVDDQGHPHDLPRLIEEVLSRIDVPASDNIRRWLQKDFFAFHLKLYSKSRRKAPIYWPLSTASGSYTLWIYYPCLTSQTLFTAVNDFLDGPNGKLTQVSRECAELRLKGSSRSSEDEKRYEMLQTFEQELTDLRDTLLKIAPTYQPNHDDGVQITAAPLWSLFRHKPWQKVLKDTWTKLEKGDYDWAHLAMNYWPDRVREKCKIDKSLAIAHGLESLYVEPEVAPKKTRSKKNVGIKE